MNATYEYRPYTWRETTVLKQKPIITLLGWCRSVRSTSILSQVQNQCPFARTKSTNSDRKYIIFSYNIISRIFVHLCTYKVLSIWWHKSTQVSFCLCYLLNAEKDRTMFVSTYITKYGTLVRRCIMNARPIVLLMFTSFFRFRYILPVLKICSICYINYRLSVLEVYIRTRLISLVKKVILYVFTDGKHRSGKRGFESRNP